MQTQTIRLFFIISLLFPISLIQTISASVDGLQKPISTSSNNQIPISNQSFSPVSLEDSSTTKNFPKMPHNTPINTPTYKKDSMQSEKQLCTVDLTASYVNEMKFSETKVPIEPEGVVREECPHIEQSCCSTFEFESLQEQFQNKKTRIEKTFELLEDTIEYVNLIGETTFSKFKFALLEKFEDKCQTPHIDVQLAHLHLTLAKDRIIEISRQALQKRRSARSSRACEICDYDFHRLFQGDGEYPEMQVSLEQCELFLQNHAQQWIDFLNVLWELSLINHGLKCVMRESNSEDYIIQEKLAKLPHRLSASASNTLNQDGKTQSEFSIINQGIEYRNMSLNESSRIENGNNELSQQFLMAEKNMMVSESDRSIIQTKAKIVLKNLPNLNLQLLSNLPNLEEETEIDGLIKQCQVSSTPLEDESCVSLCLDWFFSNQIESQLPLFLRDIILTINNFFYSHPDHQNEDHPDKRKKIEDKVENRDEVKMLGFKAYLEAYWNEGFDQRVMEENVIDLDLLGKAIIDEKVTPSDYQYLLQPFRFYMLSEYYASKFIVKVWLLASVLFLILKF